MGKERELRTIESPLDINNRDIVDNLDSTIEETDYLQYTKEVIEFIFMEKDEFEEKLNEFIEFIRSNKNVRILYSEISSNIYLRINDSDLENVNINLEKIKDEFILKKFKNYPNAKCIEKIIIKIYDHFNLAIYQLKRLKYDDEDFKKKVGQVITPVNDENNQKIDKKFTEIDSSIKAEAGNLKNEFIGLIGMFTAMSFLVFGGVEFLGGVFSKIEDVPVLKLIMIGCIWSLCISNLIYAFMFFVESMIVYKKEHRQIKYFKKYPMIIFSNYILIFIFLFSSWGYYCRKNNINNIIFNLAKNYSIIYLIIIILLLIVSYIFISKKLKNTSNEN